MLNEPTTTKGNIVKWHKSSVAGNPGVLRFASALLLAGILPAAWAGPREDGDDAFKAGKMAEAAAAYTQALAADPNDALALIGRGRALQSLGKRTDAAADFERAVHLAPASSEAWLGRGLSRYFAKNYEAALADLDKAVALDPQSARAFQDRGVVHDALKDYKAGVADCTQALKIQPNNINAHNERGYASQQLGDPASALHDFEAVIKLDPRNSYALTHRAMLYEAQGQAEKAMLEYRFVLAIDPKQRDAARHLAALTKPAAPPTAPNPGPQAPQAVASPKSAPTAGAATQAGVAQTSGNTVPAPSGAAPQSAANAHLQAPPETGAPAAPPSQRQNPPANKAVASAKPAPAAGNPPQADNAPVPVSPVPPGKGYFKLVDVEMPPVGEIGQYTRQYLAERDPDEDQGHFLGKGTHAGWVQTRLRGRRTLTLNWIVPEALIPGEPAQIHLSGSSTGKDTGVSAFIDLELDDHQSPPSARNSRLNTHTMTLVEINHFVNSSGVLTADYASDDFTLVIPDVGPLFAQCVSSDWKPFDRVFAGNTPTILRMRNDVTLRNLVIFNPQVPLAQDPKKIPLIDKRLDLDLWFGDPRLIVRWSSQAYAVYGYHWVGPFGSAPGSEALEFELAGDGKGGEKKDLRADGRDGIYVRARVKPNGVPDTAAVATAGITFTAEGADAKWVDLHYKPEVRDGWQVTLVQASNPDAARRGAVTPPAKVTVMAHATENGHDWTRALDIPVAPNADIDAKPDIVEFSFQSGDSTKVAVAIDNAGPGRWDFHADYDKTSRKVALADIKAIDGKSATLTLKEAGLDPLHDGSNREQALLKITAEQKGQATIERDIKVNVVQEGLFVSTTGRDPLTGLFVVNGDGKAVPTEIDVRVYAKDPKTKKIVNVTAKEETLKALSATCLELKGTQGANVLEVGKLDCAFSRVRQVNDPAAVLRLVLAKEIPADGRVVPCDFKISYAGDDGASFSSIITVGVATMGDGPGSQDWQLELDRCQDVITKFVPAAYYPKMQAMLDKRKMTLGPNGLRELRRKIWVAAAELTLGEGGQGYASEAAWAGAITDVLEWSQWAGNMTFNAVIGTWTGPYGSVAAGMLKDAIVSAINAYQDGETADEWLWENLGTVPGLIEGQVVDPSKFQAWGMQSKAKVWTLYISYHFLKNLYEGQTLVDALKNTAREARDNVLGAWLGEEVQHHGNSPVTNWAGQKADQVAATLAKIKAMAGPANPATSATAPETTSAAKVPAEPAAAPEVAPAGPLTQETVAKKGETEPAAEAANSAPKLEGPETAATGTETTPAGAPAPEAAAEKTLAKPAAATEAAQTGAAPAAEQQASRSAEPTPAQEAEAVTLVRSRTITSPDGRPFAHPSDVIAIMTDPTMVRALKKAPPEVQQAFSNTREMIYRRHDEAVVQHVKDNVDGMKDRTVKVIEFRTPGDTGASLNTDRDYRVCYLAGRDANGKEQWIEVPRRHWEAKSYQTFAELTGGPTDSPEASKDWAADHQQLATDKSHEEASAAFSDQKYVYNKETGHYEWAQVVSNVEQVKAVLQRRKWNIDKRVWETVPEDASMNPPVGADDVVPPTAGQTENPLRVNLEDPAGLGLMFETKVHDAHQPQEGFVQAKKAVETLTCLRESYGAQGRKIGNLPPEVQAGMQAVLDVNEALAKDPNRRDVKAVAAAEQTLRANGFSSVGDFMHKLGGQFESLKLM